MLKIKDKWSDKVINIDQTKEFDFYLCGPDVYDHIHVGNARPIITYDILIRLLKELNIKYKYVHNITDVADKIINAAKQLGITESELSEKYYNHYVEMFNRLNLIKPTVMPKVTDNINAIIKFVSEQFEKGTAYRTPNAIMFSANHIPNPRSYHQYTAYDLEEELDEYNKYKKDPRDFTLWRNTNDGDNWNSPWGNGRPGWHTECAFFVHHYFNGKTITMHSGGIDLEFPHHMCENAQFEGMTNHTMAEIWNYVGHIHIDGEKMSKSSKNTVTALDFINQYSTNALKYIMFSSNKEDTVNFTKELIEKAVSFSNGLKNYKSNNSVNETNKKLIIEALCNNLDIKTAFKVFERALENNTLSTWEINLFGFTH